MKQVLLDAFCTLKCWEASDVDDLKIYLRIHSMTIDPNVNNIEGNVNDIEGHADDTLVSAIWESFTESCDFLHDWDHIDSIKSVVNAYDCPDDARQHFENLLESFAEDAFDCEETSASAYSTHYDLASASETIGMGGYNEAVIPQEAFYGN